MLTVGTAVFVDLVQSRQERSVEEYSEGKIHKSEPEPRNVMQIQYCKHPHIRTHDFGGQADRVLI